jgi:hypothetical protein
MLPGRGGQQRVRSAGPRVVGHYHPGRECVLDHSGTGQRRQLVPVQVAAQRQGQQKPADRVRQS